MLDLRYRIDAANVAGETVYSLRFADAVNIIQAQPRWTRIYLCWAQRVEMLD